MPNNLTILRLAGDMTAHSAARHSVIARNVANADTPQFKALDLAPVRPDSSAWEGVAQRATRSAHMSGATGVEIPRASIDTSAPVDRNGNSVSLEREMVRMAENRQAHDLALSVYKTTLSVLRTSLSRG